MQHLWEALPSIVRWVTVAADSWYPETDQSLSSHVSWA